MTARRDKGTALIVAMIAVFVVSGLIATTLTVVMQSDKESIANIKYTTAIEDAESGAEQVLATLYRAKIDSLENFTLVDISPDDRAEVWVAKPSGNGSTSTVYIRSYRAAEIPLPSNIFDVYEITSVSQEVVYDREIAFQRGVQQIVELPLGESIDQSPIPAALYTKGDVQLNGNYVIDGADHTLGINPDDPPVLTVDASLSTTYLSSHAGFQSEFWVERDGEEFKVFDDSDGSRNLQENTQVFQAGDQLNFFIKTFSSNGDGIYRHYAYGDGPESVWYPTNGDPPKPYCRIEQIDDVTFRLFFEDLRGDRADWDYGVEGDLTVRDCIRSTGGDGPDQVVEIIIVPEGESGGGTSPGSGYVRAAGIPAIGYEGEYDGLGVSEDEPNITTITETGDNVSGVDAYTYASLPLDKYAELFKSKADPLGRLRDISAADGPQVSYYEGDGTIAGQVQGSGVLIVNGDLHISGQFKFDGLVIVTGDLDITGGGDGTHIVGAIMSGEGLKVTGNSDVFYSSKAIEDALKAAGVSLDDLRELMLPTQIDPPVHKLWRELDNGQLKKMGLIS